MKVHELIDLLLKMPQGAAVTIEHDSAGFDVSGIELLAPAVSETERTRNVTIVPDENYVPPWRRGSTPASDVSGAKVSPWRDSRGYVSGHEAVGLGHPEGCVVLRGRQ